MGRRAKVGLACRSSSQKEEYKLTKSEAVSLAAWGYNIPVYYQTTGVLVPSSHQQQWFWCDSCHPPWICSF